LQKTSFVEITVSSADNDVFEDENGELQCNYKVITLGKGLAALRFNDVPLKKGAKVQHAYLQVYGEVTDEELPHFVITAASSSSSTPLASFDCGAKNQLGKLVHRRASAKNQVVWEKEDEGWERHTVWVSPDLKDLVNDLISRENWNANDDIILMLNGKGNRAFYSADKSACFAPTLAFELVEDC